MNEPDERATDGLDRQLRAIAEHAVGMSRAANTEVAAVPVARRNPRPLIVVGAVAAAVAVVAAAAIVSRDDGGTNVIAGAPTALPMSGPIEYGGNITVLESAQHGPQLCTAVEASLPPQCGGPDVVGWDWNAVDTEESAGGTTWGSFYVVGTWIDGVFTLTRPATAPVPTPNRNGVDFTTPCEDLRTDDPDSIVTIDGPLREEESIDDFAGAWWDARHGVLNVAFTGDIDAHEAALREQYGGRLCVVQFDHSESELLAAQELFSSISNRPPGVVINGLGIDTPGNRVSVDVLVADEATRAFVAQHLGEVDYVLHAALLPVESSGSGNPEPTLPPTDPPKYPNHEIDSAAAALDTWLASGIEDYSFHIEVRCFCPGDSTTIVVSDGVPDRPSGLGPAFSTIPSLIAEVERAEREATGDVEVRWGPYGVPEVVSIDWIENAIDDEISWTISEFAL
jgi:Family of unknown function (DUF6174)